MWSPLSKGEYKILESINIRKTLTVIINHVIQRTRTFICCMGILVCGAVWLGPGPSYPGTDGTPLSSGVMPAMPSLDSIPSTPEGDSIRLGYNLTVNTQTYAKTFVGNALSCTNCHLDAGRKVGAGTYVGVLYAYPQYKARVGKEISLGDRINECFERSLNGKALPPHSPETEAIPAYMSCLSQNVLPSADLSWLKFSLMTMTRKPESNMDITCSQTLARVVMALTAKAPWWLHRSGGPGLLILPQDSHG